MKGPFYFAIVGCRNYSGAKALRPKMLVQLTKEPENEYDGEAIAVFAKPFGKIGYVANSVHTVPRGCSSAGRIYDLFDEHGYGIIRFVLADLAIAELLPKTAVHYEIKVEMNDKRRKFDRHRRRNS